ncbi:hypothetical protein [Saccharothrix sp.]|uniref:hypothetical protein n=1 Tax=Saccharothrix sp. TaxID=1873460 RepID=UPI0028122332|nr:hypothetical protein [Saccharothrix sp.]
MLRRPVTVLVLHNADDQALITGYRRQPVIPVLRFQEPPAARTNDIDLAEHAFALCNIGDDPEHGAPDPRATDYRRRGNRSLSIGDVVIVDGRAYACQPRGWLRIPKPAQTLVRRHGSTPLDLG